LRPRLRDQHHQSEQTLLYQIVERYYPSITDHPAEAGKHLPAHGRQAFDGSLQCGRLEYVFLRLRCDTRVSGTGIER